MSAKHAWTIERNAVPAPSPTCNACRRDDVEIDQWGLCPECMPRETETCEDWADRVKARRVA